MRKIILLLFLCIPFISISQSWDDTVRSIEKIFERYKPTGPGAQLAISRHGQVIFSKAWGMADMEHNADRKGRIINLKISSGRARNVEFKRVPLK